MSTIASHKKRLRVLVGTGAAHGVNIALSEMSEESLGKLLEKGDELRAAVIQTITVKARELSTPNEFSDEEVRSSYGYLSGYKPKGLTEQTNTLRQHFSGIGFTNQDLHKRIENGKIELPKGAEGWFAIPNWVKNPSLFCSTATYGEAVETVLATIKQTRNGRFYNYREGQLGPKQLRQSAKTEKFFRELSEAQGNPDILIVPAQFGLRHRGRSVRRARAVMNSQEFGLGAFAVGIMLLTHADRLQNYDDLWIDCAGDEFSPDADGEFTFAPIFEFYDGKVKFYTDWIDDAIAYYGSASGFVPQI